MDASRFVRALMSSSISDEELDNSDVPSAIPHDNTQTLRIVSIFVILATGLLGGLPPLFLKVFQDSDSIPTRIVRSFAAGVIAALALVHIIPEAVEEMTDLGGVNYPLGGTCVLGGVALMIFLEHMAHIMHNGGSSIAALGGGLHSRTSSLEHSRKSSQSANQALCAVKVEGLSRAGGAATAGGVPVTTTASIAPVADGGMTLQPNYSGDLKDLDSGIGKAASSPHGHRHVCVSRGPASNWLTAGAVEAMGNLRLKVVAYLFELGCIFHSFIIGLSLGVNQTDIKEVRSLLIALAFHQGLEGVSLASVIIRGRFSRIKGAFMILTYSLTCPVGIAVGMAIAETYDAESMKSRGIQGTLNGLSGGMLLYIALVQLVAEDMGRLVPGRDGAMGRMACFAALCGGAASMCLLAIWA